MNTQVFRDKFVITALIIVAILAFFAGSEYKAYQIRSVMSQAFGNLGRWFSGTEEKKKEVNVIKVGKWQSYTMTWSNGKSQMKIWVMEVLNLWKEFQEENTFIAKRTAKNNFYWIIFASENIGKEPSFVDVSQFSLQWVLNDGTKFTPQDSIQWMKKYDWYGTCVSCNNNPGEKSTEWILFDIPNNFDGGSIEYKIDNDTLISFEL